ncbi:fimbrial protein [Enterobacter cancerogenus]
MFFKKTALVLALATSVVSMATMAATPVTPTTGTIQFQGELVNSACGLSPNSSPVKVDFGQVPTSLFKNDARVHPVHQNIELQDCDTTVAAHATVTYTPTTIDVSDSTLAAFTSGTAKGVGIGLTDSGDQDVEWGKASSQVNLKDGTNMIPFVAYLKADNASGDVTPGEFQSTINFQIDYQ